MSKEKVKKLTLDDLAAAAYKQSGNEADLKGWLVRHPKRGLGEITKIYSVTHNIGRDRYIDSVCIRFQQNDSQEIRFTKTDFDRAGFLDFYVSEAGVKRACLLNDLQDILQSNYLSIDEVFSKHSDRKLLTIEEYSSLKVKFVKEWVMSHLDINLDDEQSASVAAVNGDVRVVARAGSGKTRVLVTRAIFLQQHCGVLPDQLLLLAFNRQAANEMKSRLRGKLGENIPHVMTFHALAHAIIHPNGTMLYDAGRDDQFGLSREIQEIIDQHIRSHSLRPSIREIMLADFRNDWVRIVNGRFELTMNELLAYRRALTRETLNGEYVRSFGEKLIANALFENSITYQYERAFRWEDTIYRPDFTITLSQNHHGVIIEYFGREDDPEYDRQIQRKKEYWAQQKDWELLDLYARDLKEGGSDRFISILLDKLDGLGIKHKRLSEDEIWNLIKNRAIDRFTRAMKQFINRCRLHNMSDDALGRRISKYKPCSRSERLFLKATHQIFKDYLVLLAKSDKDDFSGLLWQAVKLIKTGTTGFVRDKGTERGDITKLRYILVDEFQDFSEAFFALTDAIRTVNPNVSFFCVGDDWQAINRFAGSDLSYFSNFQTQFRDTTTLYMPKNYRSVSNVVNVSNALMEGRGTPAVSSNNKSGCVQLCKIEEMKPTYLELELHQNDLISIAVLRLIKNFLKQHSDGKIALLARRNELYWPGYHDKVYCKSLKLDNFSKYIKRYLPARFKDQITVTTVHSFKGKECNAVIILDALEMNFPLIHPNWQYNRIFGDTLDEIIDEERRLFYVAITRAKNALYLLSSCDHESQYIKDIRQLANDQITEARWSNFPYAIAMKSKGKIIIIKGNTYHIKNKLYSYGFHWDQIGRWWYKIIAENSQPMRLLTPNNLPNGVNCIVYSNKGERINHIRSASDLGYRYSN